MYQRWLEISHEALIRGWPQFHEWLQDRQGQRLRAQITESAKEWEQLKRDDSLLYRGARLTRVLEWRKMEENRLELNALEHAFIGASEALRVREQEEKEVVRQRELARERELRQQAERLAEEQKQRADEQAAAQRRQRWLTLVSIVLAAVAIGAAVFSQRAETKAREAAQTSLALQLSAQSSQMMSTRLAESLLLSIAALLKQETPEARGNLATVLRAKPTHLLGYQWGHTDKVFKVAFSPDGKTLASASRDRSVTLWDIASRKAIGEPLKGHGDAVWDVGFSPDGKILASASGDGSVILWDVATRKAMGEPLKGHREAVSRVAFSPDGKTLASASGDQSVILWDLATRKAMGEPLKGHTNPVSSVTFSPDGKTLASASWDQSVILWDVASRKAMGEPLKGHTGRVSSVDYSPDGKTLASASWDKSLILWDASMSIEERKHQACAIVNRNMTLSEWRTYLGEWKYEKICPNLPGPGELGWLLGK